MDVCEGPPAWEALRRSRAACSRAFGDGLDDRGTPSFDKDNAAVLAGMGIPVFGCTPDAFPELMALAIRRGDVAAWAASRQAAAAAGSRP